MTKDAKGHGSAKRAVKGKFGTSTVFASAKPRNYEGSKSKASANLSAPLKVRSTTKNQKY